jgi:hypothetical protein
MSAPKFAAGSDVVIFTVYNTVRLIRPQYISIVKKQQRIGFRLYSFRFTMSRITNPSFNFVGFRQTWVSTSEILDILTVKRTKVCAIPLSWCYISGLLK